MQGGHFIPGRGAAYVLEEANVWPQCRKCNMPTPIGLGGNYAGYRKGLMKKLGYARVKKLEALKTKTKQWDREELADLWDGFKLRIKIEKKRLGIGEFSIH